jgi:hypothetical protein
MQKIYGGRLVQQIRVDGCKKESHLIVLKQNRL